MHGRIAVCVFVKPPRTGASKTRLVPAVGAEGAAVLARAFLEDTWRMISSLEWADPVLVVSEQDDGLSQMAADVPVWTQGSGDLGARLERGLRRALARGLPAIAVGADSPGLPRGHMEALRAGLITHEAVLGPAEDGGFYALGLRHCRRGLLRDLPWSQADTCDATARRLREAGLLLTMSEPWFDVDRPGDLARLAALLAAKAISAPATRATLAQIGYETRPVGESRGAS